MSAKLSVLKELSLGQRVAEDEAKELQKYFVKTTQWEQLAAGKIDVVYGPKGSGKSALYTSLLQEADGFRTKRIIVIAAENVRGATVFKSILTDPPTSELEFATLWKLYILILVANYLRKSHGGSPNANALIDALETAGLLPAGDDLGSQFRSAVKYLRGMLGKEKASVEYELTFDGSTGMPAAKRKVRYAKKDREKISLGDLPLEQLFTVCNVALEDSGLSVWLAFDRLDVAFVDSSELERNALRALFRAYADLKLHPRICLKIFVRDDVWRRITRGGFTEASHITKSLHIEWTPETLLNMVVLRLIGSDELSRYCEVNVESVKKSYDKQVGLFYKVFPDKVATGKNPSTLGWIISRTADGSGLGRPRELIHLLDAARMQQINSLERGSREPPQKQLFDRSSLKSGLPLVSKVYFEQTLLAEYPDLKKWIESLDGQKSTQTLKSLSRIWKVDQAIAQDVAKNLVEIGFFEKNYASDHAYRVPFLLRPALQMVQGTAVD